MPELPEVETVVRGLRPHLQDAVAVSARAHWPRVLDGTSPQVFNQAIAGKKFTGIHRRAKYICTAWEDVFIVIHLRMTGRLYLASLPQEGDRWVRFSLALEDGRHLHFSDSRKFGRVQLCHSLDFLEEKLGPEPLDLNLAGFKKILTGSKRAVKPFLLDQKKIAGIGNIYADESLHRAGIHPGAAIDQLSGPQKRKLFHAVQHILSAAIRHEGASISWYRKPDGGTGESQNHFTVYGRKGEPCLTCGSSIQRVVMGQRSTHFCAKCQPVRT